MLSRFFYMAINFLSGIEKALGGLGKKKPEDLLSPTTETGMMPAAPPVRPPALPAINAPASPVAPMSGLGARAEEILKMQPPGGPTPYDPISKAKYENVMAGATMGEDGKPQFKRSWMDALKNAGIGFLQGAASNPENPLAAGLGGAAAGGVGTAISPMRGREYRFDMLEKPRLEAEQQRGAAYQDRMAKAAEAALGMRGLEARTQRDEFEARDQPGRVAGEREYQEKKRAADAAQAAADLEGTRAKTAATKAQIDKIIAEAKAVETGKPQQIEFVDPATKKPVKALIYPDGRQEVIGGSVRAFVEDVKQSGANARAGQAEAGRSARAGQAEAGRNTRAAAKKGGASAAPAGPTVEGYMDHVKRKTGRIITADEARRALQSRGVK